ncbi:uncharacterized protein DUF2877 [Raoultella sp. BIGb0138]|uniref:DUF2877 domain-containing protein n=1 Tax=Raoultella sp. BIGb0138 TaxID=2485115 RepID=UPI001047B21F|nr:DUF2877 domain-containing protein [Raoultella sp. BIGb0138]TCW15297.1 uncharacterized protein DUF2877 [Raoultella sp. BIGb0138]
MQALTADESFLSERGSGRVEQVFSRAVNLLIPGQQRLLTLLCQGYDNAPNSCRLAFTHLDDLFRPGETVRFLDSGVAIGDDKWIATSSCGRWQMAKPALDGDRLQRIPWQRWSQAIHQQLHAHETLFLYRGDNPFYQEIARQLQHRRAALFAALKQGRNITEAVARMVGLGIGLTPSADDYLVGLSIILFIHHHPAEKYKPAFLSALQCARKNTTLLSAMTLEAAINQRYRENIAALIDGLMNNPDRFPGRTINAIKNIGSSSGCDMLYGIADACALSQIYGGNDVSQNSG